MNLWASYLESKYKDGAIKWKLDERGLEYFEVEGRPAVNADYGISTA